MLAIGQALGGDASEQWVEAMTETTTQKQFLKMSIDKALSNAKQRG
jgi:hypothetical protein